MQDEKKTGRDWMIEEFVSRFLKNRDSDPNLDDTRHHTRKLTKIAEKLTYVDMQTLLKSLP